jgi:aryl-alcohol dehydrogenase-like predicted oxidoreductase
MKLTIGTAQFGLKYGFNKKKIKNGEIVKIEKIIKKNKIRYFDTATGYGDSEKIIGNIRIKKNVITKITLPKKIKNLRLWFYKKLSISLKKLKVKRLYGLLIHNSLDITNSKHRYEILKLLIEAKKKKLISNYGISVYSRNEVEKILKVFKPDIIQFPANLFDQRFLDNDFLLKLKKMNILIFARSCFLQGLLLGSSLKQGSNKTKKKFNTFLKWCDKTKITQIEACIQFIKKFKLIDYLIVGFDKATHLSIIIEIFNKKKINVPNIFSCKDLKLIDPRKW